jgi:V-type H+-transporting ATPase subunit E
VRQAAASAAKAYKEISGRDIEYAIEGSIPDDV